MTVQVRHPPGRAGRMWLRRRLSSAEVGCDQLGRKLRVLNTEQKRLHDRQDECRRAWQEALRDARVWQLRAGMLGGQDAYADAKPTRWATIDVHWGGTAGVHHPVDVRQVGAAPEIQAPPANTAVVRMAEAFSVALIAGAELAVAEEAARRVDDEVAVTRRRVRALEKRWLPALRQALTNLEQSLELAEQEEGSRLRQAVARDPG